MTRLIARVLDDLRGTRARDLVGDLLGAAAIPCLIWLALVAGHVLSPA
jgi:hypothetical protein